METEYRTVSAHVLPIDDEHGEMIDAHVLCSNNCHRELASRLGVEYGGWNGCIELDGWVAMTCANCGDTL
jgi:hypothetical protein